MRIMIKGGVWKNTEDEILKAAVMKYGLNQWARISSLLVRKSAKQCKARWYEWLDPSIKKTEWTREEDEKLLHLAKLMPTQWRTIAPIVGRTPAQCLERYEKLLDMAVSKDERYDPADDPRRLRPGEIDPNPESKPARPDPVDMDEDEKEMLSEARARLANTRGKKAKRKAREKALEEARRLASLQKKRELKAAGIEMRGKDRRRHGIDYNSEVAFEKKPAPGFFDTSEEDAMSRAISQEFRPVAVQELEGKRRKDIEEGLVKRDIKRQKVMGEENTPAALAKAAELNDPAMVARRGRLMLPAPQVSEMELEAIARMSHDSGMMPDMDGAGGEATRQLLGNYGQTPAMVGPMRTPRTPSLGGDRILEEARQLAQLSSMQTPLAGGENPDISQSDFTGITPRRTVSQTPNPLATPGATPGPAGATTSRRAIAGVPSTPSMAGTPLRGAGGMTPGRGGASGATPMRTPIRDELGLNDLDAMMAAESNVANKARQLLMRNELRDRLRGLPEPQYQYEVSVPELEAEPGEAGVEEDAADIKARKARAEQERRAAEERKKSKVLQRSLPRPVSLDLLPEVKPPSELEAMSLREKAEQYLNAELGALLHRDNTKFPIKDRKKEDRAKASAAELPDIEEYTEDELAEAALLLEEETEFVRQAMGHRDTQLDEYLEQYSNVRRDIIWLPSQARYGRAASATNSERLESVKVEFEGVLEEMKREAKKAAKLESKVKVLTAGLEERDAKQRGKVGELWEAVQQAQTQLECFQALQQQERRAAPARVAHLRELVAQQREREGKLQDRFRDATRERVDLAEALQAAA